MGELYPGSMRYQQREWLRDQPATWWHDIFDRIACGESVRAIVDNYFVQYGMLLRVIGEDDDLEREYARALEIAADVHAHAVIGIADDTEADVSDRKLRIDTRFKLAGKWHRARYGDTLTVTRTPDKQSEEQVLTRIKALVAANPHLRGMLDRRPELLVTDAEIVAESKSDAGEDAQAVTPAGNLLLDDPPRPSDQQAQSVDHGI